MLSVMCFDDRTDKSVQSAEKTKANKSNKNEMILELTLHSADESSRDQQQRCHLVTNINLLRSLF